MSEPSPHQCYPNKNHNTNKQRKTNPTKLTKTQPPSPRKNWCLHSNSGSRHRAVLTPRLPECKQSRVCVGTAVLVLYPRGAAVPALPGHPAGTRTAAPGGATPVCPLRDSRPCVTRDRSRTSPSTALAPRSVPGPFCHGALRVWSHHQRPAGTELRPRETPWHSSGAATPVHRHPWCQPPLPICPSSPLEMFPYSCFTVLYTSQGWAFNFWNTTKRYTFFFFFTT